MSATPVAASRSPVLTRAGSAPGSARPLLSVQRFEHGRYERPPLDIRVLARPGATIRALLNGRGARRSFERRGSGRWVGHLGVKDGLRFGRNRLVVTAFTHSGLYQRVSKSVLVSRRRPLVDAGRDMQARVGQRGAPDWHADQGSARQAPDPALAGCGASARAAPAPTGRQ